MRFLSLLLLVACVSCNGLQPMRKPMLDVATVDRKGSPYLDFARPPETAVVTLCVRRSFYARRLGIHPWFLTFDPRTGRWDTWEIWLSPDEAGEVREHKTRRHFSDREEPLEVTRVVRHVGRIRHVTEHTYALDWPFTGVPLGQWTGAEAARLIDVLNRPEEYPHHDAYRLWPGPNSNTYVDWTLREAGVTADLHPMAIGKDYRGPWGFGLGVTTTRSGLQVETPLLGAKAGLFDGLELHLLTMTLGVDLFPPAFKTPFGRFGVPE